MERGLQNFGGTFLGDIGNQIKSELIYKVYRAVVKSRKFSSENTVSSLLKCLLVAKLHVTEVAKL